MTADEERIDGRVQDVTGLPWDLLTSNALSHAIRRQTESPLPADDPVARFNNYI